MQGVSDLILLLAAAGTVYWSIHEYGRYVRSCRDQEDDLPYTIQRLRRRMLTSAVLLMVLAILGFRERAEKLFDSPWWMLLYFSTALLGVVVLFLLMAADLLETTRLLRRAQREMARHSAEEMTRALEEQLEAQKPVASPDDEKNAE